MKRFATIFLIVALAADFASCIDKLFDFKDKKDVDNRDNSYCYHCYNCRNFRGYRDCRSCRYCRGRDNCFNRFVRSAPGDRDFGDDTEVESSSDLTVNGSMSKASGDESPIKDNKPEIEPAEAKQESQLERTITLSLPNPQFGRATSPSIYRL